MAYDRDLYDSIQEMTLGELIHFMISRFDPDAQVPEDRAAYRQKVEYMWAKDRIDRLTGSRSPEDRLPTESEAREAARLLLRCNGHDLDVWTGGNWYADEHGLKELAEQRSTE